MSVEKTPCPVPDCPNKKNNIGKGYSYLFAGALTALLAWQSVGLTYDGEKGLTLASRDIPAVTLGAYLAAIAGALGLKTDGLAKAVGKTLSGGD